MRLLMTILSILQGNFKGGIMNTLKELQKLQVKYKSLQDQYKEMERAYKKLLKKKDKQFLDMETSNARIVMKLLGKLARENTFEKEES